MRETGACARGAMDGEGGAQDLVLGRLVARGMDGGAMAVLAQPFAVAHAREQGITYILRPASTRPYSTCPTSELAFLPCARALSLAFRTSHSNSFNALISVPTNSKPISPSITPTLKPTELSSISMNAT